MYGSLEKYEHYHLNSLQPVLYFFKSAEIQQLNLVQNLYEQNTLNKIKF